MFPLWLLLSLFAKHWLMDYPFQNQKMLEEKGRFLAMGGCQHALLHGIGTSIVFNAFGYYKLGATLGVLDMLIHYTCDITKSKINNGFLLGPKDKWFWNLLGIDQFAHHATYVLLVWLAVR